MTVVGGAFYFLYKLLDFAEASSAGFVQNDLEVILQLGFSLVYHLLIFVGFAPKMRFRELGEVELKLVKVKTLRTLRP